ncbi:MAG: transcription elongation factor GreA [Actinomycetota bacterium]|nr:transcription elongation factor GreA [Actinomycetota bacterium]
MSEVKSVRLTQAAHDRIKEELALREGERRQKIVEDIATARAHGDLSENAEYHAAREEQGKNEGEIRRLRAKLENAEIIESADDGVVQPGKLVTLRYEGDDDPETYLLGEREERDGDHQVLTPDSPIGQALMGLTAGETAVAKTPGGEIKIEILEVTPL